MDQPHPLDLAAVHVGGTTKLAGLLDVSVQAICNWKERGVPIERCLPIERATKGAVTRRELRSDWRDIWPELAAPADPAWTGPDRRKEARA